MVGAAPRFRGRAPGTAIGAQWPLPASIARHRRLGPAAMTMSCCSAGGDPAWGASEARSCAIVRKSLAFTDRAGLRSPQGRPRQGGAASSIFIARRVSLPAMAATKAAAVGRVRRYRL